jgi:hypothetical protein
MAAGEARRLHKTHGRPVMIVDRAGRPQKSDLWTGIPYITQSHVGGPMRLLNCSGVRPYIAGKTSSKWTWRHFKPTPAEIVFTAEELVFAAPFRDKVMIEPNVKNIGHTNKAWFGDRWLALSETRQDFVQCVSDPSQSLPHNVLKVITPTFRHALAILSVSRAFVSTEGGLMHGAAATRTPAVILWSEFIAPEITGYETMTNLRHAGKPCGNRMNCPGCRTSMEAISVTEVSDALERILK